MYYTKNLVLYQATVTILYKNLGDTAPTADKAVINSPKKAMGKKSLPQKCHVVKHSDYSAFFSLKFRVTKHYEEFSRILTL